MGIDIPTYMIIIKDDPVSEYYASITLPLWEKSGFKVERFDACTPDKFPDSFTVNFSYLMTEKYYDRKLKKEHTPTEKACWYSHLSLWKKCIDANRHILILEHDSYPFHPNLIDIHPSHDFITYDNFGLGCYTISPKLCEIAWKNYVVDKNPVDIGPYGHIYEVINKTNSLSGIFFGDPKLFIPAASQIHDVSVGSTIDHFGGTVAEPFKKELGTSQRIELIKGTKPNKSIMITTIAG